MIHDYVHEYVSSLWMLFLNHIVLLLNKPDVATNFRLIMLDHITYCASLVPLYRLIEFTDVGHFQNAHCSSSVPFQKYNLLIELT